MEVVVGTDGSPNADGALDWAVAACERHDAMLRLVHVARLGDDGPGDDVLATAGARAGARLGEDRVDAVRARIVGRSVARTLLEHRGDASLVAVGARGRGGFTDLLLGSTSQQVAAHSPVPVVVVPVAPAEPVAAAVPDAPGSDDQRTLVVGVDGSTGSGAALRWAFDEASAAACDLVAVHAYRSLRGAAPRDGVFGMSRSQVEAFERRAEDVATETLRSVVESARGDRRDVDVVLEVEDGSPSQVLVAHAARPSSVLVVGRRGDGALAGMRLGSISQACLRHAGAPVVVVPSA